MEGAGGASVDAPIPVAAAAAAPASLESRHLMVNIKQCATWQQLQRLVRQHSSSDFNSLHASALLTHLAQLSSRSRRASAATPSAKGAAAAKRRQSGGIQQSAQPGPEYSHLVSTACDMVRERCGQLGARQVANCMWALSKLPPSAEQDPLGRRGPSPVLVEQLVLRASEHWHSFNGQELANLVYALAALQHRPRRDWLHAFAEVLGRVVQSLKPQEVSNVLYAFRKLRFGAPEELLQQLLQRIQAMMPECSVQDCVVALHACAAQRRPIDSVWLAAFFEATGNRLPLFNSQDVANTLHSLAVLGVEPPLPWLERLLDCCEPKLKQFSAQECSNTLYALALMGAAPPAEWMSAFWRCSMTKLGAASAQELSVMVWAAGKLLLRPDEEWLQQYAVAVQRRGPELTGQALAMTLSSFAPLAYLPPGRLMTQLLQQFQSQLLVLGPHSLSSTIYALAQLQYMPSASWLAAFLDASRAQLGFMQAHGLALTIWSLAKLGVHPDTHCAAERHAGLTADRDAYSPPAIWRPASAASHDRHEAELSAAGGGSGVPSIDADEPGGASATGGAAGPLQPDSEFVAEQAAGLSIPDSESAASGAAGPRQADGGDTIPGNASHESLVGGTEAQVNSWLSCFFQSVDSTLHDFTPQGLANVLWALAKFRYLPQPGLVRRVVLRVVELEAGGQAQTVSNTLWALAVLRSAASCSTAPEADGLKAFLSPRDSQFTKGVGVLLSALECDLQSAQPQAVSNTLFALVRLGIRPPEQFMVAVVSLGRTQLRHYNGQELSNTCWALGQLRYKPPAKWLRALGSQVRRLQASNALTARDKQVLGVEINKLRGLETPQKVGL